MVMVPFSVNLLVLLAKLNRDCRKRVWSARIVLRSAGQSMTRRLPLSKDLLRRMIAWRLQEWAFGGLEGPSALAGEEEPNRLGFTHALFAQKSPAQTEQCYLRNWPTPDHLGISRNHGSLCDHSDTAGITTVGARAQAEAAYCNVAAQTRIVSVGQFWAGLIVYGFVSSRPLSPKGPCDFP
jgi:hypothetical protein